MTYIRLSQIFIIFPTVFIVLGVQSYLTGALFLWTCYFFLSLKKKSFAHPNDFNSHGIPTLIFIIYMQVWWLVLPSSNGFQNVATISVLLLMIHSKISWVKVKTFNLEKALLNSFMLLSIGYLIQVLNFGLGSDTYYSPRATSSILMIAVIFCTYLYIERRCGIISLSVVVISLITTLSRASIGGAIVGIQLLFLLRKGNPNRVRKIFLLALVQTIFYSVFTLFEPLRSRFTYGDNAELFGIKINTSGRLNIWKVTINEWKNSPIFGNGPGSTEAMLQQYFPNISHPHNEYLRLLHDYGIVGLTLWLLICYFLMKNLITFRNFSHGINLNWQNFRLALFCSFLFAIFFENYIVYIFFILPFAVCLNRENLAETN